MHLETRIKYLFTKNCAQEQPVNVWYKYVLTYKYIYRKCHNTVIHVAYSYYNNGNIIISTKQSHYNYFFNSYRFYVFIAHKWRK